MVATQPGPVTEADLLERVDGLLAEHPPASTEPAEFLGAQYDAGLAWVHFPVGRPSDSRQHLWASGVSHQRGKS